VIWSTHFQQRLVVTKPPASKTRLLPLPSRFFSTHQKHPFQKQPRYYGDDDALYYEEYGYYSGSDALGYDDYYDGGGSGGKAGGGKPGNGTSTGGGGGGLELKDCVLEGGKPKLANTTAPCALKVAGVDKYADALPGGIDGVYKLASCHNGRPLYLREKSPKGQDRVLWYSKGFGDWDVSNGTKPTEKDILMYGGDTQHAVAPLFVDTWHVGADLKSDAAGLGDDDYFPVPGATVKCADGKVYEAPAVNPAVARPGPVLTDDEMLAKYRAVYEKYGRRPEPNPTVNASFMALLVLVGLGTVLAIPYMLTQRGGGRSGGRSGGSGGAYAPVPTTSFAQIIQQSKKKASGHDN
jgi:hypothetical protein